MGKVNLGFGSSVFAPELDTDAKAPTRYAVYLSPGGLGLPDRDYYLSHARGAEGQVPDLCGQDPEPVGWADPEANAKAIVAMRPRSPRPAGAAPSGATRQDLQSDEPRRAGAAAPGFPWGPFLDDRPRVVDRFIVTSNTAFPKIAKIYADTPIETLQAWAAFHVVDNAAPYLSKRFVDAHFEFRP